MFKKTIKDFIDFHQTQYNRLRDISKEQAYYHKGAIAAYSKCLDIVDIIRPPEAEKENPSHFGGFHVCGCGKVVKHGEPCECESAKAEVEGFYGEDQKPEAEGEKDPLDVKPKDRFLSF